MKIDPKTIELAREKDPLIVARLSIKLHKSTRTIERYLKKLSFPDKLEEKVQEYFQEISRKKSA